MKIQKNFCELSRFLQVNAGVRCRQKCGICEKPWAQTGTEYVNRGVLVDTSKGSPVEKVYYMCANCVDKAANLGKEQTKSTCL